MLTAIIVTCVTLVILGVVAFIIIRRRSGAMLTRSRQKVDIHSITTVGVSAPAPKVSTGLGTQTATVTPTGNMSSSSSEQLKSRFIAIGVLVAGVFAALATRLFGMQILSSSDYQREAEQNLYTTVTTPAPRGVIYDSQGVAMVQNRQVLTILADAEVASNHDVLVRLSGLLGIPYAVVKTRIMDSSSGAQSQRVVASDVRLRDAAFITEHADAFPGVTTQIRTTRTYPYGALAAHALGYVGIASEEDLANVAEGRTIESGDAVGKSGIEQSYDALLAGDHGQRVLLTDAAGVIQQVVSESDPTKGNDIYLTIDAQVQQVAEQQVYDAVEKSKTAVAASAVCIDVETGGIVAMANYPTYEPERFIGGISQDTWDAYQTEKSHYPLMNRAIAASYPAASCFKAFTGLAGLAYGFADEEKTWDCTGTWTGFGDQYPQKCWERSGHGYLGFHHAIVVSCDVVFYEIAKDFYDNRGDIGDNAMQDFIKEFGYDSVTGIDISGEEAGRIPTPEWKRDYFKDAPEQAQWLPGDISNMVIGQGYVLVTPIQVARAYAAVASGKLMKPHLLKEVRNSQGDVVLSETVEELTAPDVSEAHLNIMRDALNGVTTENETVANIFSQYDFSAAAKTGTAETGSEGQESLAWFSCYGPFDSPRYAVAVAVEQGGSGSTSGPYAAEILNAAILAESGDLDVELGEMESDEGGDED